MVFESLMSRINHSGLSSDEIKKVKKSSIIKTKWNDPDIEYTPIVVGGNPVAIPLPDELTGVETERWISFLYKNNPEDTDFRFVEYHPKVFEGSDFLCSGVVRYGRSGHVSLDISHKALVGVFDLWQLDPSGKLPDLAGIGVVHAMQALSRLSKPQYCLVDCSKPNQNRKNVRYWIVRGNDIVHPKKGRLVQLHNGDQCTSIFARDGHVRFLSHPRYAKTSSGEILRPKIIPSGRRKGEPYFKKVDVSPALVNVCKK